MIIKLKIYGGYFEVDSKIEQMNILEDQSKSSNFWDDVENAQDVLKKLNYLKEVTSNIISIKDTVSSDLEMISLLENEMDNDMFSLINEDAIKLDKKIESLEFEVLLSGEYDHNNYTTKKKIKLVSNRYLFLSLTLGLSKTSQLSSSKS